MKHESMWKGNLGQIEAPPHRISLKEGTRPIASQPYRAGPLARILENQEIRRMLEAEVIEPAQSKWASPVVLVDKKHGSTRFCIERHLPLPRMHECLDSLGDASIFSTSDCNSGYWQLPVATKDHVKTTFTCHAGKYRFTRMPFGLCASVVPEKCRYTLDEVQVENCVSVFG